MPRSTAYRWVQAEPLPCEWSEDRLHEGDAEIKAALEEHLNDNCQYAMKILQNLVFMDFEVSLSKFDDQPPLVGDAVHGETGMDDASSYSYEAIILMDAFDLKRALSPSRAARWPVRRIAR